MHRTTGDVAGINAGYRQKGANTAPEQIDMIDMPIGNIDASTENSQPTRITSSVAPAANNYAILCGSPANLQSRAAPRLASSHCG